MDPPVKVLTAVSICEFPSCRTPIFQGSSTGLCKIHGIQAQYHNANKQKSDSTSKAAPTSKPFNKAKLHRVNNPDDDVKAILKEDKKRKREASTNKRCKLPYLRSIDLKPTKDCPASPSVKLVAPNVLSKATSKLASDRTPEEKQYLFNLAAQNKKNAANALSGPVPKVTDRSNPESDPINLNLAQKSPRHEEPDLLEFEPPPANKTTQPVEKIRPSATHISPKLGPPPPIKIAKLAIVDIDEDASPGTQIAQEFRATVEKPQPSLAVAGHSFINRLNSFRPQDPREQELMDIAIQKELDEDVREDEEMHDALFFSPEPEPVAAEDIPLPSNERDDIPVSPALTSISSSTTPDDDILLNAVITEFAASPRTESIEAKRKLRAAKYNSNALDSFLVEQSRSAMSLQPTPEELAKPRYGGHIDPRVKWPKQHCDDWLTEKRQEVKERGGRKANFGKLLTSQVLKERSEKGWGLHQNKEISIDDEKLAEGAKALEELLGIKGIDELEPGVRNGRLGMTEKSSDDNGRKRKPKMYPIGY